MISGLDEIERIVDEYSGMLYRLALHYVHTAMVVDRPFFCAIVDKPTGVVLFAGAVSNPRKLNR